MHTGVNAGQSVVDAGQSSVDARMQAACMLHACRMHVNRKIRLL